MSDSQAEKERILLSTHIGLEMLVEELKPVVENKAGARKFPVSHRQNKKLLQIAQDLSYYFRYKWEEEKAQNSVTSWRNEEWQLLKRIKETLDKEAK